MYLIALFIGVLLIMHNNVHVCVCVCVLVRLSYALSAAHKESEMNKLRAPAVM